MNYLLPILEKLKSFREISSSVEAGALPLALSGVGEVHKAHFIAGLSRKHGRISLVVASDENEAARFCTDLRTAGCNAYIYPVRDLCFHPLEGRSRQYEHERIETLCRLLSGGCDIVVATADALMQLTIPPHELRQRMATLYPGGEADLKHLANVLTVSGYERCDLVEGPGQFSVRGGIIDIFPPDSAEPVRIELWGDEIDTMSYFDTQSQRRTEPINQLKLFPASELTVDDSPALAGKIRALADSLSSKQANAKKRLLDEADALEGGFKPAMADKYLPLLFSEEATVLDYLPDDSLIFVSEYANVRQRAKEYDSRLYEEIKSSLEDGVLCKGLTRYTLSQQEFMGVLADKAIYMETFARSTIEARLKSLHTIDARQYPTWDGQIAQLEEDITPLLSSGMAVGVLAGTAKAADALARDLESDGLSVLRSADAQELEPGRVTVLDGAMSYGYEYPEARVMVVSWGRGALAARRKLSPSHKKGTHIQSLSELSVGDYVVHVTHGIGLFGGIVKMDADGVTKDYIKITYDKSDVLYVPVTQLDMVSKYVGGGDNGVKLSRLGGTEWSNRKARVRKAVRDIADKLIKLYAERMQAKGYQFEPDGEWQRDFESHFEYDETDDQLKCISDIKHDMESPTPMDRLLCGDVGFGKTEVAMRAAFKCVCEGKQCALLAPTTILAWQHYQTALRRFDGFPVRVELISRYRSPKQREEILKALARGEIDFIIGTHSVVQKSVKFHDLGLAIIDEEQRFGVAQKERFKEIFSGVDVLTLTATPIPRTLNMALSGLRDISAIEEAPINRHPVQTFVVEYDSALIADAIRRELRRGGQVYYIHNRVSSINAAAERVQKMAPDANIGIAHGQMSEEEVSREWKRLIDHETDILVCTTLIEAGVDVANVNTLIIEQAQNFGLAQLHQIRGRVGRSSRRAYAYLTFPPNRELTEIAAKRLAAIRQFTEFGSGMKIAMRDLELRGAGNVLGAEQSGQMQTVGYDLYLKLLDEAVAKAKGEKVTEVDEECTIDLPIEAHIPEEYIESLSVRLDVYRLIASVRTDEDAMEVTDELIDRFGDPPKAVTGLVRVSLLRAEASALGVTEIKYAHGNYLFYLNKKTASAAAYYCAALPGRVMLSMAGEKVYLTVRPDKRLNQLENISQILSALRKVDLPNASADGEQ